MDCRPPSWLADAHLVASLKATNGSGLSLDPEQGDGSSPPTIFGVEFAAAGPGHDDLSALPAT